MLRVHRIVRAGDAGAGARLQGGGQAAREDGGAGSAVRGTRPRAEQSGVRGRTRRAGHGGGAVGDDRRGA